MEPTSKEPDMADAKAFDHGVEYLEEDFTKSLRTNAGGEIRNPLAGLSEAELSAQVVTFCDKYGFNEKIDVFQRAAFVAQRPHEFESMPQISEDEKYHLRREVTNKWRLPFAMYMCIAVVSIGSALQYVQSLHPRQAASR